MTFFTEVVKNDSEIHMEVQKAPNSLSSLQKKE